MIGRLGLRDRILLMFTGSGILFPALVVLISYVGARDMLAEQAFEQLTNVREQRAQQLEVYFHGIEDHLVSLAADPSILETATELRAAAEERVASGEAFDDTALRAYYAREFVPGFEAKGTVAPSFEAMWPSESAQRLQLDWIANNPHPAGSKQLLDAVGDGSAYDRVHALHHPHLRVVQERFGYYDLFLISPEGRVVYSVFKELDFGTSLATGPWRESGLAEVYRAAVDAPAKGAVQFVDFQPYGPSYDVWASFMAVPLLDGEELIGVLAVQMPVGRLNDIMTNEEAWEEVGMGRSGETYLVGRDHRLRSQSRFLVEDPAGYIEALRRGGTPNEILRQMASQSTSVGLQTVDTTGAHAALDGETGGDQFTDYRGVPVLSAYRPVEVGGVRWALMSEVDQAEAFAPASALGRRTVVVTVVGLAIIVVAALLLARSLLGPVRLLASRAAQIAAGDLDVPIEVRRGDELGELAGQIEAMRTSLRDVLLRQEGAIEALKVPIIPLNEQTLVLPLVGVLDAERIDQMRHDLVRAIHSSRAEAAIVDITGVPVLAREDAASLTRMAGAVRLVGAHLILTGMRPDVASVIADLDLSLGAIHTERTLESGLLLASTLRSTDRPDSHR